MMARYRNNSQAELKIKTYPFFLFIASFQLHLMVQWANLRQ